MSDRPEDRLHEGINELAETAKLAVPAAREEAKKVSRRSGNRTMAIAIVVSILIGVSGLLASVSVYRHLVQTDASVSTLRQLAEQGFAAGQQANATLAKRGQATVPIPQPGTTDDTNVLVAAATAKVLAALPELEPTSTELGQQVAQYFSEHPVIPQGPTPTDISAALAGYFVTNPPPSGPPGQPGKDGTDGTDGATGAQGEQGPAPTEAQIQQAFTDYISQNPNALCPNGGVFTEVTNLLATDGTTYSGWLCVTSSQAPVPPPTTTTVPTTTPGALLHLPGA